ncbi:hypothetical protein CsatB_027962 [Cannabis sativa]
MREIGDRLDHIGNERMNFHLREVDVRERRNQIRESRRTGSVITQPHVYGRDEDKERVVGFLLNDAINCNDTSVFCIVGLGGIGKTTLAQCVFNDERVSIYFELKMWVCVSEDFDLRRLIKAIIESGTGSACEALEMDPLQKRLQGTLQRKRFLIVLDDVWNEDHEKWDKLKYILECGSKGASLVVTTRLKKVASIMGTTPMQELSSLSEDDCWSLFKQRAFGNHREERPNLVEIGKEIVKKCKGVPLAAKALGGLMCFKSDEEEWLSVMRSELWNLPEEEASILPALKLSYLHLPVEQRRCFSYCATFPKDHEIEKTRLIHLWMANGLISSKPELNLEVEDVGNEMINDLCWRSFFQEGKDQYDGSIRHVKMHDLFHDLAQSIMGEKCHNVLVNDDTHTTVNLSKRVRHLICMFDGPGPFLNIPSTESLRTFMTVSNGSFSCDNDWKFRSLRAFNNNGLLFKLSMSSRAISSLVSNLKHVRYLNLSSSSIEVLPDSICLLHHLLTLDLSHCYDLCKLPKHMIRLKGLRHLYINYCHKLSHLPQNIGKLSCLKTLTNFIVDKRKGCQLNELKDLNIGGDLDISNLENVIMSPIEARFANLSAKRNLKGLRLSWNNNENISEENAKDVLEALAPPTSLKWLEIDTYKGVHFPSWFCNDILGSVVRITLTDCHNCLELPRFGKLTSLQQLTISHFGKIQDLPTDFLFGLNALQDLEISSCRELKCLPEGMFRDCPLQSIIIYDCKKLSSLSESFKNLTMLNSLQLRNCPAIEEGFPSGPNHLISLQLLIIRGSYDAPQSLAVLPEGLQYLSSLEYLELSFLRELASLPDWLGNLTTLKEFKIKGCPDLECIPMSMQRLTNLKKLFIVKCPKLEQKCEKEVGEDWYKISHIPDVRVVR